ncbi:hypothetical protein L2E82_05687 [Cichorium intybus]|uniref:Uncharacterized protein n=1 Tax=Cichorium intybus TaxID=13427 RepID=A0ACB9H803_CICIN|nr:hypothetical protein L2E82_05687 [Cichorium intybus]
MSTTKVVEISNNGLAPANPCMQKFTYLKLLPKYLLEKESMNKKPCSSAVCFSLSLSLSLFSFSLSLSFL